MTAAEVDTFKNSGLAAALSPASEGDEQAVAEVYRYLHSVGLGFAARQGADDPEGVVDLAAWDTIRALPNMRMATEATVRAYFFRASRSHVISQRRRPVVDTVPLSDVDVSQVDNAIDPVEVDVLASAGFDDMLAMLSPSQRDVVDCRYRRGLSLDQTSTHLGKSIYAVKFHQAAALRRLRIVFAVTAALIIGLISWAASRSASDSLMMNDPTDRPELVESPAPERSIFTVDDPDVADSRQSVVVELEDDEATASGPVEEMQEADLAPGLLSGSGLLRNRAAELCVAVSQGGSSLELQPCDAPAVVNWTTMNVESDIFKLVSPSDACLDRNVASVEPGTVVLIHACHSGAHQLWQPVVGGEGHMRLVNRGFDLCVQPAAGRAEAGAGLEVSSCDGDVAQDWSLVGA